MRQTDQNGVMSSEAGTQMLNDGADDAWTDISGPKLRHML